MNRNDAMTTAVCSSCSAPLGANVMSGLCPRCVGRVLLDTTGADESVAGSKRRALRIGEYELADELGRGAMGVVYRARQPRVKRDVAVKVILASRFAGESARKRFLAEAELAAQLDHPNIVPIHEVCETPDGPFYVMKLVEGGTLASLAAPQQNSADQTPRYSDRSAAFCRNAATLISKVAHAVHHAHQRGVLHRDLKPGNILIDAQGEPHVTDFGLARQLGADSSLTLTGSTLGTPAYMAPEQAAGERGVTTAADVWSLGAILFHLLTGRPPFVGATAADVLLQARTQEAPSLRGLNPAVPRDLETVCLKCLEKEPARRYVSAAELAADLERWLNNEPIRARPASSSERVIKWTQRNPVRAALTFAVLVVSLLGVAGISWQWRRAEAAFRHSQASLWQANFDRAHALRMSGQMGQRVEALKAIRAAAAIRSSPELREEAIAAMALPDIEDTHVWVAIPTNQIRLTVDAALKHIAVGRHDGAIEVLRFPDGQRLAQWTNSTIVRDLQFSRSGHVLLVNDTARGRVWDWARGQVLVECPYKTVGNGRPHLSPDGRWLVFADSMSSVAWRDVETGQEAGRIDGLNDPHGFSFSPDGDWLAVRSGDVLQVWRTSDRTLVASHPLRAGLVTDWHEGELLLPVGDNHALYIWDVLAGRVQRLAEHRREAAYGLWHPGGGLLTSSSWDNVLRLWDPFAGRQLLETRFAKPQFFSGGGSLLCVVNAQGIGQMRMHIPAECRVFHAPVASKPPSSFDISPDERFLAGTRADQSHAWIWKIESGERIAEISLAGMKAVQFHGDRHLVTSSGSGVLLWTNVDSGNDWKPKLVGAIVPGGSPHGFTVNGNRLLLNRGGASVALHEFPSGKPLFDLHGQPLAANFSLSSEGKWIATGYWDNGGKRNGSFCIWSAADGQLLRQISIGNSAAHFSPDGRWLLAAGDNEYLQFAVNGHPTNWPMVRRYSRETTGFRPGGAAFSGDGALLALMADDTIVRLMESATGREMARFTPLPDTGVECLRFSQSGRWLAGTTEYGPHVWDLALIRARLREMNLDWNGPPHLSAPPRSAPVAKPRRSSFELSATSGNNSAASDDTNAAAGLRHSRAPGTREFPPRDPAATHQQIDLSSQFNALLTENWFGEVNDLDNSLSTLPRGLQTFGGVKWDVRAIVQLSSTEARKHAPHFPESVRGIRLGLPCHRLHFLLATGWGSTRKPGTEVGHFVMHLTNGEKLRVPLNLGENIADFWVSGNLPERAEIAWEGINEEAARYGTRLRLCKWTWPNPSPGTVVESVDFVSAMTKAAPFLLAITAE